ncbi:MAG: hypothetical protein ACR2KT_02795 [Methylocella sp.]|nr:MAG: hypothetical protein DLM68_04195 [Hyphomicrobiales bacterium]
MWLTVPVEEQGANGKTTISGGKSNKRGTPQGGVISPLLSNLYMNRFPSVQPSPSFSRVGIRDFTFEVCTGFTHVMARRVARPPKAAFVTRLRSGQLTQPNRSSATRPIDNYLGGTFL